MVALRNKWKFESQDLIGREECRILNKQGHSEHVSYEMTNNLQTKVFLHLPRDLLRHRDKPVSCSN